MRSVAVCRNRKFAWALLGLAVGLTGVGCSKSGGSADGGGGTTSVKDIAFVRESRGIVTSEPQGLRNLEVFIGGAKTAVTTSTSLDASVCQERCALTSDRAHLVYLKTNSSAVTNIYSVPVTNLVPSLGSKVQLNEKPLAAPTFYLVPGSDRIVYSQIESEGGSDPDGGATPPTYTVASASAAGGSVIQYRTASFLPSSPLGVSPDGSKVLFAETVGAASQLNLYVFPIAGGSSATRPIFQFTREGSAEFGGEKMTLSPNGNDVFIATQLSGDSVIMKVTADGRTTGTPPYKRIGPVECQAAGDNEVCAIYSDLFPSTDGSKLYFLGGRVVGAEIVTQIYALDASLATGPVALTNFTTEVLSMSMNRARTRFIWATEAERFRKNNAIFAADFNGATLQNPTRIVDDPLGSISFHFQEGYFLE